MQIDHMLPHGHRGTKIVSPRPAMEPDPRTGNGIYSAAVRSASIAGVLPRSSKELLPAGSGTGTTQQNIPSAATTGASQKSSGVDECQRSIVVASSHGPVADESTVIN